MYIWSQGTLNQYVLILDSAVQDLLCNRWFSRAKIRPFRVRFAFTATFFDIRCLYWHVRAKIRLKLDCVQFCVHCALAQGWLLDRTLYFFRLSVIMLALHLVKSSFQVQRSLKAGLPVVM